MHWVAHQPTLTRPLGVNAPDPPPAQMAQTRWSGEPGWLRPAQAAAALLGVHVDTVARWHKAGLLPQTRKDQAVTRTSSPAKIWTL